MLKRNSNFKTLQKSSVFILQKSSLITIIMIEYTQKDEIG